MKKLILCICAAAALLLTVSCAGKEATKDADSGADGQNKEAMATQVNLDFFSLGVPQGWKVDKASSFSCTLKPLTEPQTEPRSVEGWYVEATFWNGNDFNAKETAENFISTHQDAKLMEPLTFGALQYEYYFEEYEHAKSSLLLSQLPQDKGLVEIQVVGYTVEDPDVQAILNSFRLKE